MHAYACIPLVEHTQGEGTNWRPRAVEGDPIWHPHVWDETLREPPLKQGRQLGVGEGAGVEGELKGAEDIIPHEGDPRPAPPTRTLRGGPRQH